MIRWYIIGALAIALCAAGSFAVYQTGEARWNREQVTLLTKQRDDLQKANGDLIAQAGKVPKADKTIDVRYRDRYHTIDRVIVERDLVGANAIIKDINETFYDTPLAEPEKAK